MSDKTPDMAEGQNLSAQDISAQDMAAQNLRRDEALDAALAAWARKGAETPPEFLFALAAIPDDHPQWKARAVAPTSLGARISAWLAPLGGWRAVVPQAAAMVVAGWLGISSGAAALAADEADLIAQVNASAQTYFLSDTSGESL